MSADNMTKYFVLDTILQICGKFKTAINYCYSSMFGEHVVVSRFLRLFNVPMCNVYVCKFIFLFLALFLSSKRQSATTL